MKLLHRVDPADRDLVASRAEAWVETDVAREFQGVVNVASRAEAWVETDVAREFQGVVNVASRAEAWVETSEWRLRL